MSRWAGTSSLVDISVKFMIFCRGFTTRRVSGSASITGRLRKVKQIVRFIGIQGSLSIKMELRGGPTRFVAKPKACA